MAKHPPIQRQQRFGRWVVLDPRPPKKDYCSCQCDCGTIKDVAVCSLRGGCSVSCGCFAAELTSRRSKTHGETHTPLHRLWVAMRNRCYNKNHQDYLSYGGRGIKVEHEPWLTNYIAFRQWALANGWQQGLLIDRVDVNRGYAPWNCRFVTLAVSNGNKRTTRRYEYSGESKLLSEWAQDARCVVSLSALEQRVQKSHWTLEKALTTPLMMHKARRRA